MKLVSTPSAILLLASSIAFASPDQTEQINSTTKSETTKSQTIENIPIESFLQLLAAEMALDRIEPEIALANYIAAAKQTQDKSVAKRATEIALTLASLEVALQPALLWSKLAQNDLEAQITLAAIYLRLRKAPEAVPYLIQLSKINSEMANQHYLLLYQQLPEAEEKEELIKALKTIAKDHKEAFSAELSLAEILLSQQKAKEALTFSKQAMDKEPNRTESIRIYSLNLAHLNQIEEAKQLIQQKMNGKADFELKRFYLDFLMNFEQTEEGKRVFQDVITEKSLSGKDKLDLAKFAMQAQWYNEAKKVLMQLKGSTEHKDIAHYFLARLAEISKTPKEAIEWYKQVLTGPFHLLSQLRASMLLSEAKEFDAALLVLQRAQPQTDEDQKRILMSKIDVMLNAKMYDKAIVKLNKALSYNDADIELRYARSLVATNLKQIELAETDLKWIISHQENHIDALNALGYLLTNHTKRYQEAYQYLEKALKLSPNNPIVLDSMGWLYYKMGKLEESVELLQKASGIVSDPEIAAHLGEVLWHMKDYKKARQIWNQGLALSPNNENILNAMQRLLNNKSQID